MTFENIGHLLRRKAHDDAPAAPERAPRAKAKASDGARRAPRQSAAAPLPFVRPHAPQACKNGPIVDNAIPRAMVHQLMTVIAELSQRHGLRGDSSIFAHQGKCYSIVQAWGAAETSRRAAYLAALRQRLTQLGLPCEVASSGGSADITLAGCHKGSALRHFSQHIDVPCAAAYKFGDQAGPDGNDRLLLRGPNAFNVGCDVSEDPDVRHIIPGGPDGVLAVLQRVPLTAAIVADLDGTLIYPRSSTFDAEMVATLVARLMAGAPIAIITGRPVYSIQIDILPPLLRGGASPTALRHLMCYCCNGAFAESAAALLTHAS